MRFSSDEILPVSHHTGFKPDMVEKVFHLLHLLGTMKSHPFLKGKWVLKGGTALNMFLLKYPRLSVDIDINYLGALDREDMLQNREKIDQAATAVFSREGFNIKRIPNEHAGGKWRLAYQSYTGQSGNIEVDMNFMFRQPLWEILEVDSHPLGELQATNIPVLDLHEIAAGKLAALLSRKQSRDLFDCHQILKLSKLDTDRLRIAFVVYGGMNRKDWRTVSVEDVDFVPKELAKQLIPTLHNSTAYENFTPEEHGTLLIEACKKALSIVLPFLESERAFLDLLLERGEIDASILTKDEILRHRIQNQPLLKWKAFHVKKHKGLL